MMRTQSLPWCEPLELAAGIDEPYWVLLYSGTDAGYSGRYSYLAHRLAERVEGRDFSCLEKKLGNDGPRFDPAWFGYLGYSLKDSLEKLVPESPNWLALPELCLMRFHSIYEFDHHTRTINWWFDDGSSPLPAPASPTPIYPPRVTNISSPMSQQEYLDKVAAIIKRIHEGDLYQANLTRKFTGTFAEKPDGFFLFKRLCELSPAPYSAFIRLGDTHLISSSPERFLTIDPKGEVTARPIKGTAARYADAVQDAASREWLAASEKDRAENLMIVDLMRNDLARSCLPGSVEVKNLFDITTHATIHHMSSTIAGQKRPECRTLDVVRQCFPPGSMTGAPKIKAMNLCAELENHARGAYSGAIGWFSGDGGCDLSVVIRTLIIKENRFEFQVGGGIVANSVPALELAESLTKARGILLALDLSADSLEGL